MMPVLWRVDATLRPYEIKTALYDPSEDEVVAYAWDRETADAIARDHNIATLITGGAVRSPPTELARAVVVGIRELEATPGLDETAGALLESFAIAIAMHWP